MLTIIYLSIKKLLLVLMIGMIFYQLSILNQSWKKTY